MIGPMSGPQKWLIVVGASILIAGLAWPWLGRIGLGRLPGDFTLRTGGVTIYAPLATCILISIVLSLILWLVRR
jgi:hypothetical protein